MHGATVGANNALRSGFGVWDHCIAAVRATMGFDSTSSECPRHHAVLKQQHVAGSGWFLLNLALKGGNSSRCCVTSMHGYFKVHLPCLERSLLDVAPQRPSKFDIFSKAAQFLFFVVRFALSFLALSSLAAATDHVQQDVRRVFVSVCIYIAIYATL